VLCVAAWSVHHVGALAASFVSGGDDYLFILFDGNSQVRATTSSAAALAAAAAAAIAALLPSASVHALLLTHALRPWPSQAVACAQLLAAGVACDNWQIQKWPFATVSAAVARCVVSLSLCCCSGLCT
jgi:hypothetical protein